MTIEQQWQLAGWASLLVPIGITLLFFFVCSRPRRRGLRAALAVFVGWVGGDMFYSAAVQPICIQRARAQGDDLYDGTGGGAASLLLGWFLPLISVLLALACRAIWRRFHPPKSQVRNS
jgi:hypothetical protein